MGRMECGWGGIGEREMQNVECWVLKCDDEARVSV